MTNVSFNERLKVKFIESYTQRAIMVDSLVLMSRLCPPVLPKLLIPEISKVTSKKRHPIYFRTETFDRS